MQPTPTREGELIFDYVYKKLNCTKPWKRVWIEDLTEAKIKYAFNHLKESKEMTSLQLAGEARSIADWLFGINFTVAMTSKFSNHNGVLACGRVQTPTLALIVNRESEIKNFIKKPYYKIIGKFTSEHGNGDYTGEYSNGNIDDKVVADKIIESLANKEGVVKSKTLKVKKYPLPCFLTPHNCKSLVVTSLGGNLRKPKVLCSNSTKQNICLIREQALNI